jgi:predicted Zn finger-like uncharacterized protein
VSASAVTQCPHCRAKFRVRAEQARAHNGLVRCGACRGVFNVREHIVEGSLDEEFEDADTFGSPQTILAGVPPAARTPSDDEIRAAARAALDVKPAPTRDPRAAASTAAVTQNEGISAHGGAQDTDYDWRPPTNPLSRGQKIAYGMLSLLALAVLIAQALYWFRDEIASRMPSLAPTLAAACAHLNCRVLPPKRAENIGFVGADLALDPAHKGLLIFNATLRNTGSRAVAFPSLVLTLEGVGGEAIARRVFAPEQYAPANANLARGLEGGADMEIKLYLDASPATPVGFKADHAYF